MLKNKFCLGSLFSLVACFTYIVIIPDTFWMPWRFLSKIGQPILMYLSGSNDKENFFLWYILFVLYFIFFVTNILESIYYDLKLKFIFYLFYITSKNIKKLKI